MVRLYPSRVMSESLHRQSMPESETAPALRRMGLFVYLIPVLGSLPALWLIAQQRGDRQQRYISRLSVTLAASWLLGYALLGASNSGGHALVPLLLSSLLTSGYFLLSLGLMAQLWRRRRPWVPGLSRLANRLR